MSYAPFVFSSPMQVIAANTSLIPDVTLLGNRFRKPLWIDEVRFAYMNLESEAAPFNMGLSVRCKLSLGRVALTGSRDNGFVPISMFGPSISVVPEELSGPDGTFGSFRWRLPKPLFVPANDTLRAQFFRTADGFPGDVRVSVAYAGRYTKPEESLPNTIDIPYVDTFIHSTGSTFGLSSERDLVNPFPVDLNVQRLISRTFLVSGAGISIFGLPFDIATEILIKDSYGHNVVRDFVAPRRVFDPTRSATTAPFVLKPNERINVQFRSVPATYTPMVSMVGWRREVYR